MNDRREWSRRQLLGYAGVGTALAIAGCNGSGEPETADADGESNTETASGASFELAGDGADAFREWLHPDHTLETEQNQLYQYNDIEIAREQNWTDKLNEVDRFAETLGAQPDSFSGELLLGPVGEFLNRIYFGEFDTAAVGEKLGADLDQTDQIGEFTIYGDVYAVREDLIIEHPSYETVIETENGNEESISDTDEDIALLLDLLPRGLLTTIGGSEDEADIAVEGLTVTELGEELFRKQETRTFVFEDESSSSTERAREIVEEGSEFEEISVEEHHGRVVMLEVRR